MHRAYGRRATEYTALLGAVEQLSPVDREHIERWAAGTEGPILDLGCGPGHWTAHLADLGHEVRGLDPVPAFVEIARDRRPDVAVEVGEVADLAAAPQSCGGVLAWYSLIHLDPAALPAALGAIRTALRPCGRLLLGLFDALPGEEQPVPFDHAVVTAHRRPAEQVCTLLREVGFEILGLTRRTDPGSRPHLAIEAVTAES